MGRIGEPKREIHIPVPPPAAPVEEPAPMEPAVAPTEPASVPDPVPAGTP
jgi:hypothetical protein